MDIRQRTKDKRLKIKPINQPNNLMFLFRNYQFNPKTRNAEHGTRNTEH